MAPKSLALLGLALFFVGASSAATFSAKERTDFDGFLKRFRLKFGAKDYDSRLELFQKNLKKIEGFNRHSKGARFAANKFAAMTEDEIKHYLVPLDIFDKLAASYNDSTPGHSRRGKRQAAPASVNYVTKGWATPVKDQSQCGACWAFTSCACVESAYLRHNAVSLDLAEQHLVDCTPAPNQGCGGGILPNTMDWIIANGVGYETNYPYTSGSNGAKGTCKAVSPVEKNVQYTNLGTSDAAIVDWVANKGPVGFGFYVPQDFMYYAGGAYETDCGQPWAGGHALTILGYTPDYWIIKNSWGLGWGEDGYVYWARTSPICHLSMAGYNPQVVGVTVATPPPQTTTAAPQPTTTAAPETTAAPQPPTTAAPQTTATPVTTAPTTSCPPVPTTPGPISCQCPNGYTYFAGSDACYKVVESVTFDSANQLCAQDGGALASIHSAAENDFIAGFIQGFIPHWIAFVNQYTCGYCWNDGTEQDYQNWSAGYPQAYPTVCPGHTGGRGLVDPDTKQWTMTGDCAELHKGVCKVAPKSNDCRCGDGYFYFAGTNSCFKVVHNQASLTWHAAAGICAQEGGQLASIHSAAENDFVVSLASRVINTGPGEPNVWIGFQNAYTCGVCWTDSSPLDYQNWATDYPRGVSANQILWHGCPGYVGARGILVTDNSSLRGQWVSTWACEETHAAVCKRAPTA